MDVKRRVLLVLVVVFLPVFAQAQIELNTEQDLYVPASGFYPFSEAAKAELQTLLAEDTRVAVIIEEFSGKTLKIAPAADFKEFGSKKSIKGDRVFILDFKRARDKGDLGLSFDPGSVPASFHLRVEPFAGRSCKNPVNCKDDCGENMGKCCEADKDGNQAKICVSVGTSSCGCAKK